MSFRKCFIFVLIVIAGAIAAKTAYLNNKVSSGAAFPSQSLSQSEKIRIVGPNRDPNPVVNENGRIQLTAVDASGQPVSGAVFQSGSPEIASVDPNTGMVVGASRGYATITAKMGNESFSTFVVVARLSSAAGNRIQGDTQVDTGGAVYISDPINNVILKKNTPTAEPALFAGRRGMRGVSDGQRLQALFAGPTAVAVDNRAQGGVYIADTLNHGIRKIDFNNQVSKVLGAGAPGRNVNDVTPFDQAAFSSPRGIAADTGGNLYISDTDNNAIYLADFSKREVRLIAGQPGESGKADGKGRAARFNRPTAIAVQSRMSKFFTTGDPGGIYVADAGNNRIRFISFDGRVTTLGRIPSAGKSASSSKSSINPNQSADEFEFVEPQSISVDGVGNVYVIDKLGAKLVTQPSGQIRQVVSLAQADSFQQAASLVVRGNQTFVLDAGAATVEDSLKVVTVGEPEIAQLRESRSRIIPNVPLEGGVEVSIAGRNFAPESQVTLGDGAASAMVMSATEIRVLIPAQKAPGNRTLSIQTRGGVAQTEVSVESMPLSSISDGQITTVAGGVPVLGNGGKAVNASLNQPRSITVDGAGNLFIGDLINRRVRRVDAGSGIIISVAGNGTEDFAPNAPATSSGLRTPAGVAVDESGNLFISDSSLRRILRVDNRTGILSIFAGTGNSSASGDGGPAAAAGIAPQGIALDGLGNLLIADTGNARIRRVDAATGIITTIAGNGAQGDSGDGGPALNASFRTPIAVALDPSGNIYIGDTGNRNIRKIDADSGIISTIAGNGESSFNGDDIPALSAALEPAQLSTDGAGNIFVVDNANNRVRRIDAATGIITTAAGTGDPKFSGDGGPAVNAGINPTGGVSVDGLGNVFIGDFANNRVRRVDAKTGIIATVAGNGAQGFGGDGGKVTAASLDEPEGVAFDSAGNFYIADTGNNRIRRVDAVTGVITTIAGNGTKGFDGDGGLAVDAALNGPRGAAVDKAGNLLIADTENNRIRQINLATGVIVTIAGGGNPPDGLGDGGLAAAAALGNVVDLAVDRAGNIFASDTGNQRIRRIDAVTGIITTAVGTGDFGYNGDGIPAKMADLALPQGLAVDEDGNLLIADTANGRVRLINAATGIISTIAGGGDSGLIPRSVSIDGKGNLLISDISKSIIRKADMRTGSIVTIAGIGIPDFGGDGGPALSAGLNFPTDLAVDKAGNLFIADTRNDAIRAVKGTAQSSQKVMIDGASFAKSNLLIAGSGFGASGAKAFINDLDVSSLIAGQNPTAITLKGSKKKLNLKKGQNRILVTVNGAASNVFVLNLFNGENNELHIISPLQSDSPSITNFSPSTALPGTRVTINGNNFNSDIIAVLFNNAAGVGVDKGTANLCSAVVPANATTGKVTVIRSDGKRATSSGNFVVIGGAPTIASFSPTSGPIGTVVSINGSSFKDVTEVRFGNAVAAFTVSASSTLITAVVPSGATDGPIALRSSGGTAASPVIFTVTTDGPLVEEEARIDDGTFETGAAGDGLIIVNRFTPSSYPAKLQKISIGSFQFQDQPSPVGQMIRLVAFVDPNGSGTPPSSPSFVVDQFVAVPRVGGFVEFVVNGPQIDRGDIYVGYQAPSPIGGVIFAADTNGVQQRRSFFSMTNGQTFQGPLALSGLPVNTLIRGVFAKPQAQPDFRLNANPASQSINAGQTASFNIGVQGLNGFAQAVNLSVVPPNVGLSANFSANSITPGMSATLNVSASANTPAGTYNLTVTGRSGQITKTATVVLNVASSQPQPDFRLNANPASQSINAGQTASFNIGVQGLNGFAQAVNLSVNSPAGITAGFSSIAVTPGSAATMNVSASANTAAGAYNLTVTGRSGQITKTATVVLNVAAAQPQPDFVLNANPTSRSIAAGQTASFNLDVQSINGFAQLVALNASLPDPSISGVLSSLSVSPGNTVALNVAASANAAAGTYSIVITGRSGQIVKSATVNLIVTEPKVEIRDVSYNKPILLIGGSGFNALGASVNINGAIVSSFIVNRIDTAITLRGNRRKLNLVRGSNRITITIGGIASNTFTFTAN